MCKHTARTAQLPPKDAKSPQILLSLLALGISVTKISSPLSFGRHSPCRGCRQWTPYTGHRTPADTVVAGSSGHLSPPCARAVEEGPKGQMRGDQGLTTLLALDPVLLPLCWRPTSRVPLPAHPSHLPVQDPKQGGPSTCHLPIASRSCPGREGRTG